MNKQQPNLALDGMSRQSHPGYTLANALLANSARPMGRSFKYYRHRGILSARLKELDALPELRSRNRQERNVRATIAEQFGVLIAKCQNRWPSFKFDAMAIIRKAAGLAPISLEVSDVNEMRIFYAH